MSLSRNKQEELDIYNAVLGLTEILSNILDKPDYVKQLIIDINTLTVEEQKKYDEAALIVQNGKQIKEDADKKLSDAQKALNDARIQNDRNQFAAKEIETLKRQAQENFDLSAAKLTEAERLNKSNLAARADAQNKLAEAAQKLAAAQEKLDYAQKYDDEIKQKAQKIKLAADGL